MITTPKPYSVPTSHWSCKQSICVPRRRNSILVEEIDGAAVLQDVSTRRVTQLNETAYLVWVSCDGVVTTTELASLLTNRFDVEPETALDHVEQLIVSLAESGLLESEGLG